MFAAFEGNRSKVAYPKQFYQTKKVKATTAPLYNKRHGLIGVVCFNNDIDAIPTMDKEQQKLFFDHYCKTFGKIPDFEKDHAPAKPK